MEHEEQVEDEEQVQQKQFDMIMQQYPVSLEDDSREYYECDSAVATHPPIDYGKPHVAKKIEFKKKKVVIKEEA